jgi:hypothetical protein
MNQNLVSACVVATDSDDFVSLGYDLLPEQQHRPELFRIFGVINHQKGLFCSLDGRTEATAQLQNSHALL